MIKTQNLSTKVFNLVENAVRQTPSLNKGNLALPSSKKLSPLAQDAFVSQKKANVRPAICALTDGWATPLCV